LFLPIVSGRILAALGFGMIRRKDGNMQFPGAIVRATALTGDLLQKEERTPACSHRGDLISANEFYGMVIVLSRQKEVVFCRERNLFPTERSRFPPNRRFALAEKDSRCLY
jgi:hypothetical protein